MSTELVQFQSASLPDMVRYAEHLANANLLPGQYRKQPANVLYAMEYGRTLGITPVAAITGIHVIEGKPSASAALISGLVRQAGHKLRVRGNGLAATAQIVRSDDPDFTYEVTWELKANTNGNPNAQDAGLMNKDVWKKYPAAMLKARAISAVARDACEEVLFGLHYTPEELGANVGAEGEPMDAEVQQLRRVPAGEADPWAASAHQQGTVVVDPDCFVPHPEGQAIADAAAENAKDKADIKKQWTKAAQAEVINSGITAPDTKKPDVLGTYLTRLAATLPDRVPAGGEDDAVVEGEIVPDPPQDEHAGAVAELRAFATEVGIDDIDRDAYGALGAPLAEVSADAIRGLLAQLRGQAA
ncbi:hypothetical protein [Streptomyces violaceusniger]|uniref:hypothetical protein n=1 Tax=Streptomyces violaceusniger TaxID=68280 RepID=UPI0036831090